MARCISNWAKQSVHGASIHYLPHHQLVSESRIVLLAARSQPEATDIYKRIPYLPFWKFEVSPYPRITYRIRIQVSVLHSVSVVCKCQCKDSLHINFMKMLWPFIKCLMLIFVPSISWIWRTSFARVLTRHFAKRGYQRLRWTRQHGVSSRTSVMAKNRRSMGSPKLPWIISLLKRPSSGNEGRACPWRNGVHALWGGFSTEGSTGPWPTALSGSWRHSTLPDLSLVLYDVFVVSLCSMSTSDEHVFGVTQHQMYDGM
jgi:hypothetical protein